MTGYNYLEISLGLYANKHVHEFNVCYNLYILIQHI